MEQINSRAPIAGAGSGQFTDGTLVTESLDVCVLKNSKFKK